VAELPVIPHRVILNCDRLKNERVVLIQESEIITVLLENGGDPNTERRGCTQYARRGGKKKVEVDARNSCSTPEVMGKPIETLPSTLTK
jgi:hypothetical protein